MLLLLWVRFDALDQLLLALTVVIKSQSDLSNLSHVEEEAKFVEGDSSDWDSLPIYDIYLEKNDLLEEVSFSVDTVKIVEENDVHNVFDESPKVKYINGMLRKLIMFTFLGLKFLIKIC